MPALDFGRTGIGGGNSPRLADLMGIKGLLSMVTYAAFACFPKHGRADKATGKNDRR